MKKVSLLVFGILTQFLIGCSDVKSVSESNSAPQNYSYLIQSIFVHPYEELLIEIGTELEIHFESTEDNYDSVYTGVLWLNQKQISTSGLHWPHYENEIPCSNVIGSLPMASNSVIFETITFNNAYKEATNLNRPHHKIAFVFPNGIASNASVHVCLTSFDGDNVTPSSKSLHTLGFQRVR